MDAKIDAIMRKITGLLAKADHPNTPPAEADSCRSKAEELMVKYRIEEMEEIAKGNVNHIAPIHYEVVVCPVMSKYANDYLQMMGAIVHHVGGRWAYGGKYGPNGEREYVATITAFEADAKFAEILFQSARIVFGDRMEPKWRRDLTDQENVYWMRKAGMERIRIAEIAGWVKGGAKVTRLYKAECERRGEDPVLTGKGIDVKTYRAMYAESFVSELFFRLERARDAAISGGGSGGLVLANRKEIIDEAYYERHPHLRPSDKPAIGNPKAKPFKWTAADERRWQRRHNAAGRAGAAAGSAAAKDVDLGTTGRLDS